MFVFVRVEEEGDTQLFSNRDTPPLARRAVLSALSFKKLRRVIIFFISLFLCSTLVTLSVLCMYILYKGAPNFLESVKIYRSFVHAVFVRELKN